MRRTFIALIAGGLLLVSGVAASAKLDSTTAEHGQHGQQQLQSDKKPVVTPAAKPTAESTTKPATKPTAKPATAASPTTCNAQAEQTGEFEGEHQDADCNDQSGAKEKTEATDKADAADASEKTGNNED